MDAAVTKFVSATSKVLHLRSTSKMRTFVGLFLALALFECISAVTNEYHERALAAKDKCAKEFNIDDDTIKEFIKLKKLPETQNGKCMVNCFMEEMKVMDNGKIIADEMKANNKHKWDDAETVKLADEGVDACVKELSSEEKDKCDIAVELVKCRVEHAIKNNYAMLDVKPKRR